MRKNSVVIVTGNLTCGKLVMKDGARLYVKGNITANDMSMTATPTKRFIAAEML